MPLGLSPAQAALIDPYLELSPPEDAMTPQALFGLPPPVPMTNLFSATRSFGRGGYGGRSPDMTALWSKANDIRLAQAAEQQALALMQQFQEVDPTSPNYLSQRTQLLKQYPLAQESPIAQRAIAATDYAFEKTRTESDPNRSFLQQAAMAGVTPDEVAAFTDPATGQVDTIALGNLAGERKRQAQMATRRPERDTTLRDLATEYETLNLIRDSKLRPQVEARKQQISQQILGLTAAPVAGIPATAPAAPAGVPQVNSPEEVMALPSGSRFMTPDGKIKIKP